MARLKRASYFRDNPKATEEDFQLYLLRACPLIPGETQEERNNKIKNYGK